MMMMLLFLCFFALFNSIDAVHYDRPEYGRFKDAFFDNMGRLRIRLSLVLLRKGDALYESQFGVLQLLFFTTCA